MRSLNKAFSLLELSAVLIIISILLISITSFDKLKSNVKQKAFYKEITQISEKINNFKLIYSYLPGDFPKAGKLFNHILARCNDEIINSGFGSTNRSGCNGDGDNSWDRALVSCCYGEGYMVWLHLQLANLLAAPHDGAYYYYGYQYADNPLSDGNNLYSSKILAALYLPLTKTDGHHSTKYPFIKIFYEKVVASASDTSYGLLTPEELYKLDTKYDDGNPYLGEINASKSFLNIYLEPCYVNSELDNYAYDLSHNKKTCDMLYAIKY